MTQHIQAHEPANVQRAQWAKAALAVFIADTFAGDHPDTMDSADLADAIADLICDLLHFAHYHPRMDAEAIHARALRHFQEEVNADVPGKRDLLDALEGLVLSLTPRKIASVLNAAGYSTDIWQAAHRRAQTLLNQFRR